ncbi:MAG: tetratricopeptide repeat protein [Deltaproteobacteria bacterium]|nr:tetratricopeptide repeat protein [Deltaproteobacteria bacterium]
MRLARCASFVAALAVAGSSVAQPGRTREAPSAEDKETARNLVRLGDDKLAQGDYKGALEAYRAADAIMGVPTTRLQVGRTLAALGRLTEARDTLLQVARMPREADEPEPFLRAREAAAELARQIAERIPSLQIDVVGLAPGIKPELSLDFTPVGNAALSLPRKLDPGTHVVRVAARGMTAFEEAITLAEREQLRLRIVLQSAPGPDASASPKARPPGAAPGSAPTGGGGMPAAAWVGLGLGAAGVAAGAVTGILSLSATADAKDLCGEQSCPPEADAPIDRAELMAGLSNVGFAVGVAGVGVGLVVLLTAPARAPRAEQAAVTLEPLIGPGLVGLGGRF